MVRLLESKGCNVFYNADQVCCGRFAYEMGFSEVNRKQTLKFLDDIQTVRPVVCPSSACVAFVRNYMGNMSKQSIKRALVKKVEKTTYELTEFVVDTLKKEGSESTFQGRAVFLDDSDALHKLDLKSQPRKLLAQVKGLDLVELPQQHLPYAFDYGFTKHHPKISRSMDEELAKVIESIGGIEYVISSEPAALIHFQSYLDKEKIDLKTIHLVDVLAEGLN